MGDTNGEALRGAVVQKGPNKGRIKNPLVAQEEANTILEYVGRAKPTGYTIDKVAVDALDTHARDYVLTAQAVKTVEAEKAAITDKLTGVLNRAGTEMELRREMAEIDRLGGQLNVLFMDLRGFKHFNDTYGHKIGDQALRELTKAIKRHVRPYDTVGRWGGEEFLIILKNGSPDLANEFTRRMHETLRMLHPPFHTIRGDMGMAVYTQHDCGAVSMNMLTDRADEAMYYAKRHNLDTVQMWPPP